MMRAGRGRAARALAWAAAALLGASACGGAGEGQEGGAAERAGSAEGERPVVVLETTEGEIAIELLPERAPKTVENFLGYVERGFYAGTVFHRVIPGFMVQGGGFTPEMEKKETGPPIANEAEETPPNERGTVAMARTQDPDSATAQFFVNVADNDSLNAGERGAGYAVFGRVVEGLEVVDRIAQVETTTRGRYADVPKEPVVIEEVRRVEGSAEEGEGS